MIQYNFNDSENKILTDIHIEFNNKIPTVKVVTVDVRNKLEETVTYSADCLT